MDRDEDDEKNDKDRKQEHGHWTIGQDQRGKIHEKVIMNDHSIKGTSGF
jgi:hypothetical protein